MQVTNERILKAIRGVGLRLKIKIEDAKEDALRTGRVNCLDANQLIENEREEEKGLDGKGGTSGRAYYYMQTALRPWDSQEPRVSLDSRLGFPYA